LNMVLAELSDEDKKKYFDRDGDTWIPKADLPKPEYVNFSMYIDKAVYNKESQEYRWHCVASDIDEDSYKDNMSLELFGKFLSRIESGEAPPEKYTSEFWDGGMPYLSLSHYSDQNGKGVPGPVESVYIDGEKLKGKGKFYKTPLGLACFDAINKDKHGVNKSEENPVRISIAFLDYAHKHKSNGEIFVRESIEDICPYCLLEAFTGEDGGREYLDGHLIHLALTRVPVNKRTSMEVSKSMATRKDDSESIVGEELAEELDAQETQFRSEALVTMSDEEPEVEVSTDVEKAKKVEDEDEDDKDKKKKKDEDEVEEKAEVTRHILDDAFDAYRSAYDEVVKAEISQDEKLQAMQPVLERVAQTTRSAIEGIPVEQVAENKELAQLRSMISELTQQVQILSQQVQDKSNVQDIQVPQPRSIQPAQQTMMVNPTAQEQPTGLRATIRRSVGLQN
jgi:hypothetical protein